MAGPGAAAATRLSMGRVALTINDRDRVSDFY
jgi:hypothetical protein